MVAPAPAVEPEVRAPLGQCGAAALRLPDLLLGGLRSLALEVIIILGAGALMGIVHFLVRGTPHLFADFWTAGTYFSFAIGAPLAVQTLLDDLRHPDLLDWWPGGQGSRTRFRMPSTSATYLVADAIPIVVMALILRERAGRGLIGWLLAAVTAVVCLGTAVLRVRARLRHGVTRRPPDECASLEQPPEGSRAILAVVGVLGPLVALVVGFALLRVGLWGWLAGALAYVALVAGLKVLVTPPARVLVSPPVAPTPRSRRRKG